MPLRFYIPFGVIPNQRIAGQYDVELAIRSGHSSQLTIIRSVTLASHFFGPQLPTRNEKMELINPLHF